MTRTEITRCISRNKFLLALVLVVLAGYTVGKDRALRDNARDAADQGSAAP